MTTTSNDPSIQNTDVDNAVPELNKGAAATDDYQPTPEETKKVQAWHRKIKLARAFDENVRKMYARDRRYARGETSMSISYSLIQAYIDILVAFLVARDPDLDISPSENVGQSGLNDAEAYGKTMEIVVRHLLRSGKLKRKAERWVRSALSVGIGVLKCSWQEVWGQDPHMKDRLKDAQKNVDDIRVLMQKIKDGTVEDIDLAMGKLEDLQAGLADRSEKLIASGLSIGIIRPEDMVYSVDNDSIIDTDECSWLGNRFFVDKEDALSEFKTLNEKCLGSATNYTPRKPKDKLDKEARVSGVVANVDETESDSYMKGQGNSDGAGQGSAKFLCAWEIWDNNTNQFFTVIEGITDRYANPPQSPPCPTTKFDPYFLLTFTEVDGERHPQSLITRGSQLQDEIERSMSNYIDHRKRIKPKLGFDASKVTKDTIDRLKKGTSEEFVAIKFIAGAAEGSDLRKVLFPIAYSQIDMSIYDTQPFIRALETIFGIQEALTSTVQVAKTATEADIQQAGTQAKTGYKRDRLESMLREVAQYAAECASFRVSYDEARAIAGPEAFWMENMAPEDLDNMIKIDIRAGSTGKPDNVARREAWAAVQPIILQTMQAIANFRQTLPPDFADNLEELLIETMERMGDQLNVKRFVPQAPQVVAMDPATGRPMTGEQMAAQSAAAQAPGAGGPPSAGGPPQAGGQPPADQPVNGQEQLAPTAVPQAIAGP